MFGIATTVALLLASLAPPPRPPKCRVEDISYELDDRNIGFGSVHQYRVTVTIETSPVSEQRTISGSGMLFYKYYDSNGNIAKGMGIINLFDSVPVDESKTESYTELSMIGEIDSVYDMKISSLTCSID